MRWRRPGLFGVGLMVVMLLPAGSAAAEKGWPQYRGLQRDGIAPMAGEPMAWPDGGPQVVWKKDAGPGFAQLAATSDGLFTGLAEGADEFVIRLDAGTGDEVWRARIGDAFQDPFGNGPRATPTVAGETVYALSAGGSLHALGVADGEPRWSVNLVEEFNTQVPRFGYSPSPVVEGWLLLLEVGGQEGNALVAFNRQTGEVVWSVLSGPAGYSSPVITELAGRRQIVLPLGRTLTGLGLNGAVLWEYALEEPAIAMPVVVEGDRIFISAMGDTGCAMLRIRRSEGGFSAEPMWENRQMRNHFNSSVVVGKALYGFDNATLKCLDLETGEVKWAHRGFGKGSLIAVGDRLLVLTVKGALVMVEASPEGYRELGSYQALEGKSWTAPSFSAGRVYLRNLSQMTCLEMRG